MTVRPLSITFVLLSSLHAFAQQNQPSITCPTTEQAVLEVEAPDLGCRSQSRCSRVGQTGRR